MDYSQNHSPVGQQFPYYLKQSCMASNIKKNMASPAKTGRRQPDMPNGLRKTAKNAGNLLAFSVGHDEEIRVAESFYLEQKTEPCCFCRNKIKASNVIQGLKQLKKSVQKMKEEKQHFREEVELLSANFEFILELVAENITTEAKKRIEAILEKKNKTIYQQLQKIHQLEEDNFEIKSTSSPSKDQAPDADLLSKVSSLETELQRTHLELKQIKSESAKEPINEEGLSPKQPRGFCLMKSSTMDEDVAEAPSETFKMKSLQNLKLKINKLKKELKTNH